MFLAITIGALTCLAMILLVLFLPKKQIGKFSVSSYWIAALVVALSVLALVV